MAKRYARTVGDLKAALALCSDGDMLHVEHVRDGMIEPVGLDIYDGHVYIYAPSLYELRKEGDDVPNIG